MLRLTQLKFRFRALAWGHSGSHKTQTHFFEKGEKSPLCFPSEISPSLFLATDQKLSFMPNCICRAPVVRSGRLTSAVDWPNVPGLDVRFPGCANWTRLNKL